MSTGRTQLPVLLAALAIGALVGFGWPLGELWLDCRTPTSEGCVWGKALLPVSLSVGAGVAALVAGVSFILLRGWRRQRGSERDG